jgi:hypothetical protein
MRTLVATCLGACVLTGSAQAWNNGQSGNTKTDTAAECGNPPYATHDWIADHALGLLPDDEKAWLLPHRALYLLGTEAPDNKSISTACETPNRGYDDRSKGHSIAWTAAATEMLNDRAAVRAQEEYSKAVVAFQQGQLGHAAFFLGAMAHYIGDVSQYGHSWPNEVHHADYEVWAASRSDSFNEGVFESFIDGDTLVRRTPFTAARRISQATFAGKGAILPAPTMDRLFPSKPQSFMDSVGASLNLAVNELADVLHTFFLNVAAEDE